MAIDPVSLGVGVGSELVGGLVRAFSKRPKYKIQPEAYENQALGSVAAFGNNSGITQGMSQADTTAAQDVNTAQQYSSNAGSILNTLKAINNNRNQTKQNLAITQGQMRQQGLGQLQQANKEMIDEKDKEWNYNVNQPYQNRVAAGRDILKGGTENFWKMLDYTNAKKLLTPEGSNNRVNSSYFAPSYDYTPSDSNDEMIG